MEATSSNQQKNTRKPEYVKEETIRALLKGGNAFSGAPFLIGHGYDTHILVPDRKFILGGVEIPFAKGLLAHSDGDVLLHALTDAVLGAMGWGDIGRWFPDSDNLLKNADSKILLREVLQYVFNTHLIVNADITVLAQKPKLAPFFPAMKEVIASIAHCPYINLKATTTEKMNDEGKGLCVSVMAVCLLGKKNS